MGLGSRSGLRDASSRLRRQLLTLLRPFAERRVVGDGTGGGDASFAGLRHTSAPSPVPSWLRQREQQQVFPVLLRRCLGPCFGTQPLRELPSRLSGHVGSGVAPRERQKHWVHHQLALFIFYFDSRSFN